MLCEGGCRVNSVAKFGDFRRLVVEVLQWNVCWKSFEKENGFPRSVLWVNSGFLAGFLALVECTRERKEFCGCSECVPPRLFSWSLVFIFLVSPPSFDLFPPCFLAGWGFLLVRR